MQAIPEISDQDVIDHIQQQSATLIDIRNPEVYSQNHIKSAINIQLDNINEFAQSQNQDNIVIIYCYRGNSSKKAVRYLLNAGFKSVVNIPGGFEAWHKKHPQHCINQ